MSRASRSHAVGAGQWSRAAEGRACSALLLAAHELRATAEAAEARGDEAELAADLRALAHGVEQSERDVVGAFGAAADRRLKAEEANPRLPLEAGGGQDQHGEGAVNGAPSAPARPAAMPCRLLNQSAVTATRTTPRGA